MHRRTADRASGAIPRRGRARRALIGWTVTTLLAATASGQTETCVPYIETPPGSGYARLRPHATALLDCAVDEPTYRRLVAAWLAARDPEAPTLTSFALGRAVHYPWLSRLLADLALAQPDWAGRVAAAMRTAKSISSRATGTRRTIDWSSMICFGPRTAATSSSRSAVVSETIRRSSSRLG